MELLFYYFWWAPLLLVPIGWRVYGEWAQKKKERKKKDIFNLNREKKKKRSFFRKERDSLWTLCWNIIIDCNEWNFVIEGTP